MEINLTEDLWNMLNPDPVQEPGEDNGTAWMFSNERYFTIWYMVHNDKLVKCFSYHDDRLEMPVAFRMDPMFHTAGTITITDNLITIRGEAGKSIIWGNNVVEFKR